MKKQTEKRTRVDSDQHQEAKIDVSLDFFVTVFDELECYYTYHSKDSFISNASVLNVFEHSQPARMDHFSVQLEILYTDLILRHINFSDCEFQLQVA